MSSQKPSNDDPKRESQPEPCPDCPDEWPQTGGFR